MTGERIDRRRLLVLTGSALAAGAAGCEYDSDPASGIIQAGAANDLSVGTLRVVEGQPVAVGRDDTGIYAMTLICTHEGCDLSDDDEVTFAGITCDCHGSRYDGYGSVLEGPAEEPLAHFEVTIDAAGQIIVNADVIVDAAARATL
jgi:Rieske Fe-S protein